jgi:endonuclease G
MEGLVKERAFVENLNKLPKAGLDRFRSVSIPEQKRIALLDFDGMLNELAKIPAPSPRTAETNLALGNPSNAKASTDSPNNYLIEGAPYALSYDRDKGTPNWVSWHIDSTDLGSVPRNDEFKPDNSLPEGWYRVQPKDYTKSGFDRGHMTPAADRSSNFEENSTSFTMTNIVPQAPNNNRKTWSNLEEYTRELVRQGNEVYVISGGYGSKGTLADGKINIPERTWKVIVVLPNGESDLERITENTRVIAVDVPNSDDVNEDWSTYRTSVDAIEKATGYDFLSNVSTVIQNAIEAKVDQTPLVEGN